MRSLLIAGLLIVTLIIGILVIRNLHTETANETKKVQSIDRARKAADAAEKSAAKIRQKVEEAGD